MRTLAPCRRAASAALLLLLAGAGVASPSQRSTTVLLVRHAEKAAAGGTDPALSPAGEARAAALAEALAAAGVRAVYVTQFQRTALTARPLATRLGVSPTVLAAGADAAEHARAVAADILARHSGETVLVVGHSNTIPAIVRALGGTAPEALGDNEYDNLFMVTVPPAGTGRPSTVRAHFGERNASSAAAANRM